MYDNDYEIFQLRNGSGFITISGDSSEVVLYIDGKPILFHWDDWAGSIAQYLIRGTKYQNYQKDLEQIRTFVKKGKPSKKLSIHLRPLLDLMNNGQYLLGIRDHSSHHFHVAAFASDCEYGTCRRNFYPDPDLLVLTQPDDLLNPETIQQWQEAISEGDKPSVIAIGRCVIAIGRSGGAVLYQLQ